jgi:hypothetical protein
MHRSCLKFEALKNWQASPCSNPLRSPIGIAAIADEFAMKFVHTLCGNNSRSCNFKSSVKPSCTSLTGLVDSINHETLSVSNLPVGGPNRQVDNIRQRIKDRQLNHCFLGPSFLPAVFCERILTRREE